jgi:addiction module HigA family antidote
VKGAEILSRSPTIIEEFKIMTRPPIHPGEILADELAEIGVAPSALARLLKVPPKRITHIIQGKRAITGDTALRLAHWFGTSPQLWLNLQSAYELRLAEKKLGAWIRRLPTRAA